MHASSYAPQTKAVYAWAVDVKLPWTTHGIIQGVHESELMYQCTDIPLLLPLKLRLNLSEE